MSSSSCPPIEQKSVDLGPDSDSSDLGSGDPRQSVGGVQRQAVGPLGHVQRRHGPQVGVAAALRASRAAGVGWAGGGGEGWRAGGVELWVGGVEGWRGLEGWRAGGGGTHKKDRSFCSKRRSNRSMKREAWPPWSLQTGSFVRSCRMRASTKESNRRYEELLRNKSVLIQQLLRLPWSWFPFFRIKQVGGTHGRWIPKCPRS